LLSVTWLFTVIDELPEYPYASRTTTPNVYVPLGSEVEVNWCTEVHPVGAPGPFQRYEYGGVPPRTVALTETVELMVDGRPETATDTGLTPSTERNLLQAAVTFRLSFTTTLTRKDESTTGRSVNRSEPNASLMFWSTAVPFTDQAKVYGGAPPVTLAQYTAVSLRKIELGPSAFSARAAARGEGGRAAAATGRVRRRAATQANSVCRSPMSESRGGLEGK
jgi:hypothetical protein